MNVAKMLRCKVSSDHEDLSTLSITHPWIPNSETIRPTQSDIDRKNATLIEIHEQWFSLRDYIQSAVFHLEHDIIAGRCVVVKTPGTGLRRVFQPNAFPYNTAEGNHWVMWYNKQSCPYGDDNITEDITEAIMEHLRGADNFDFVWYENPKMSVPDFYHVQVFWTTLL